jgi:hypothetical protein
MSPLRRRPFDQLRQRFAGAPSTSGAPPSGSQQPAPQPPPLPPPPQPLSRLPDPYTELVAAETALRTAIRLALGNAWQQSFTEDEIKSLEVTRTEEGKRRDGVAVPYRVIRPRPDRPAATVRSAHGHLDANVRQLVERYGARCQIPCRRGQFTLDRKERIQPLGDTPATADCRRGHRLRCCLVKCCRTRIFEPQLRS